MKRLVVIAIVATLAACTSSSAPLSGFNGTWVGSLDGFTYIIHATQTDSVVSGSGTFNSPSESGSYAVSGVSKPPSFLDITLTTGNNSSEYGGYFVTPDSIAGAFLADRNGVSTGGENVPMSLKRQ
jgi:hypothetical protein